MTPALLDTLHAAYPILGIFIMLAVGVVNGVSDGR